MSPQVGPAATVSVRPSSRSKAAIAEDAAERVPELAGRGVGRLGDHRPDAVLLPLGEAPPGPLGPQQHRRHDLDLDHAGRGQPVVGPVGVLAPRGVVVDGGADPVAGPALGHVRPEPLRERVLAAGLAERGRPCGRSAGAGRSDRCEHPEHHPRDERARGAIVGAVHGRASRRRLPAGVGPLWLMLLLVPLWPLWQPPAGHRGPPADPPRPAPPAKALREGPGSPPRSCRRAAPRRPPRGTAPTWPAWWRSPRACSAGWASTSMPPGRSAGSRPPPRAASSARPGCSCRRRCWSAASS